MVTEKSAEHFNKGDASIAAPEPMLQEIESTRREGDTLGGIVEVLVHGHCHQRVLSGTSASVGCLGRSGYSRVEVVDSGCCGMAGAFGYEKEHLSVSRKMAERRLVPAITRLPADALIAAAGTSCRAQIRDLTGRQPLHPAEIMLRSLRDGVGETAD